MGSGEICLPSFQALLARADCEVVALVTQPDRPAGRGQKVKIAQIKGLALAASVPVLQPSLMRDAAAVAELARLQPDLIVVMAYGQILPKELLELPKLACLNLHASILPRHRGAAPIQAAIESGDAESGITVMHMAEGLDTGDMLLVRKLALAPDETGGSLHDRLALLAPSALNEAIDQLIAGTALRVPQEAALATYAGRLDRESGRVDWTRQAPVIERKIRAMDPWPAAFTQVPLDTGGSAKLKIFKAEAVVSDSSCAPGAILDAGSFGLLVGTACGGALRLVEIQAEGGKRMPAGDWQRGHPVRKGGICT